MASVSNDNATDNSSIPAKTKSRCTNSVTINWFSRCWENYAFVLLNSTEHKMRFAVIENEFGEVGIDENILVEQSEEQIIEIMNGCICCTVRGDLSKVLVKMYDRIKDFDGVIIETTGLADPAPVAQTFFVDDNVVDKFKLDGIITVVDAKHVVQHLDEVKPEGVENEAVEQLVCNNFT